MARHGVAGRSCGGILHSYPEELARLTGHILRWGVWTQQYQKPAGWPPVTVQERAGPFEVQ